MPLAMITDDQGSRSGEPSAPSWLFDHRTTAVMTHWSGVSVPERLSDVEPLVAAPDAPLRVFQFTRGAIGDHRGWTINGRPFDPNLALAEVPLGRTEVWRFVTDVHHPVHVHSDAFQVLRRGSSGPGPFDVGWKDTVDLRPAEIVDVAVRFTEHAGRFVLHCHNLEHEDMAMMAGVRMI